MGKKRLSAKTRKVLRETGFKVISPDEAKALQAREALGDRLARQARRHLRTKRVPCRRCDEILDPHSGGADQRWRICFRCWDALGRPSLEELDRDE